MRTDVRALAGISLAIVLTAPRASIAAGAQDKRACIDASEHGQELRQSGKLLAARDLFAQCASDACPATVRADCAEWLREVGSALPSVSLTARDASGATLTDVRVTADDLPLVDRTGGPAVSLDPGSHVLRFEHAGSAPVTVDVALAAGEKGRPMTATFASEDRAPAPPRSGAPSRDAAPPTEGPPTGTSRALVLPIALLGGAAVAGGAAAYFYLTAVGDLNREEAASCAKTSTCSQADIDGIRREDLLAWVFGAVGVAAAGAGAWLLLSHASSQSAPATAVMVGPVQGGAVGRVTIRF